jgi:glutamine amidotransferase
VGFGIALLALGGLLLGAAYSVWNSFGDPEAAACTWCDEAPPAALRRPAVGIPAVPGSLTATVARVKKVVVLDYGSGNLRSAERALARVGADVEVTSDFRAAFEADGLVVPGVGAFAACMQGLRAVEGPKLIGRRLAGGRPVLGICVGMQVLFERGLEHGQDAEGCGEWPGVVEQLKAPVLPHMGWNTVESPPDTVLFDGLAGQRFYFVHSYGVRSFPLGTEGPPTRLAPPKVTWAEHGDRFVAGVENGALSATQFHPEKSGDAGAQLLTNWLGTLD